MVAYLPVSLLVHIWSTNERLQFESYAVFLVFR
jgi:hypothetical protein